MKKFNVSLVFILTTVLSFGQDHPKFPNIDQVFQKMVNTPGVYQRLKETYLIENPKSSKIEKRMLIGSGEIDSDFSTYKSDEAYRINWNWPDDRARTIFTITTPESSEGVKYVLPLVVEYTRLQNGVLTNEWHFNFWRFENPYSVSGGKEDGVFLSLLEKEMADFKGNIIEGNREMPEIIQNFTRIGEIEKSNVPDEREVYGQKDIVTRTYDIHGDIISYSDWDESVVKMNTNNVVGTMIVKFSREKDASGKPGDWKLEEFLGGFGSHISGGEETDDKTLYKTVGIEGFQYIKENGKQERKIPFYSEQYVNEFEAGFKNALKDLFLNKEGAKENIKKYLAPGDETVFQAFDLLMSDARDKQMKLYKNDENDSGIKVSLSVEKSEEADKQEGTLYLVFDRISWFTDKSLKNVYKDAGMSKDVLNKGGALQVRENYRLKFIIVDGELRVSTIPVREKPLVF